MIYEDSIDLIRNAALIALASFVQVGVFVFLYDASVEIYGGYTGPVSKAFGFGMQLHFSIYFLCFLASVNSVAQLLVRAALIRWVVALCSAAGWLIFWGNTADVAPNRFLLISILGLLSFLSGLLLFARIGDRPRRALEV